MKRELHKTVSLRRPRARNDTLPCTDNSLPIESHPANAQLQLSLMFGFLIVVVLRGFIYAFRRNI